MRGYSISVIQPKLILVQVSFCSLMVFVGISDLIVMYKLQCSNPLLVTFIYIKFMSIYNSYTNTKLGGRGPVSGMYKLFRP